MDVKEVEAFENLVKDVGAHKGAIIAANGFSGTARQLAKVAGIEHIHAGGYEDTQVGRLHHCSLRLP